MKLELPTGRVVELVPLDRAPAAVRPREHGHAPLFAEARALFREHVRIRDAHGDDVDVDTCALTDFHALRAIAAHEDWLADEAVSLECVNCGAPLSVRPCHAMPIGPFVERALHDDELDRRLEPDVPHDIPPIALHHRAPGGARTRARTVTLRDLTLGGALPLHAALASDAFTVTPAIVRAMGITALGDCTDPRAMARALEGARSHGSEAWRAITALFIDLHYPLRLFGVARCESCGARNDVDAPFEREFALEDAHADEPSHEAHAASDPSSGRARFVSFDVFADAAHALAREIIDEAHEPLLALVVEGGVAACDEGGVPLLGSYVPASAGDATSPSRPHEITVFHRTFRAMWEEDGPYDWNAELRETIEHEYEHFLAELAGGDPIDEEERRAIADEALRIHGKSTLLRGEVAHLGRDAGGFIARTWPLWVIVTLVFALLVWSER